MKNVEPVKENWWHDAFSTSLVAFSASIKSKSSKKKDKKDKKDKDKKDKKDKDKKEKKRQADSSPEEVEIAAAAAAAPTYEELFIATGGKRLGMRARAEQKGKIRRTEFD